LDETFNDMREENVIENIKSHCKKRKEKKVEILEEIGLKKVKRKRNQ
jgi:hypothetical protein